MITLMTKYNFVLLNSDKEKFLKDLQELGVVDIARSSKPIDQTSSEMMISIIEFREKIAAIQKESNDRTISLSSSIASLKAQYEELAPWGDYDIHSLSAFGLNYYSIPKKNFCSEWGEEFAIQVVSEDSNNIYFVIVGSNEGFALKALPAPTRTAAQVKAEIDNLNIELEEEKNRLRSLKDSIPEYEAKIASINSSLDLYLAGLAGENQAEGALVCFQGFAPCSEDHRLCAALDSMPIYYIKDKARLEDNPPIKLKNKAFARQFETFTRMYGLPVYNEFDPSIFLSIFFLLFFAMCMGDAGYGILLVLIGFFLSKKKGGLADMWTLIVTLGMGTFVVGIVLGGFFGMSLAEQSWVPQWLKSIMITGDIELAGSVYSKQMVLALGIGIVHICLALITKAVWTVKRAGFKHGLSALGWATLIVGGVVTLAIGLTGLVSENAMKLILIIVAAVSALGIFIFNRWGKNPLANIGSGLWDTYSMASGLMGDVLSYIRLYALGLSGGMLGSTFNQIGTMVLGTDPTWQWLPFVLILVFGHVLNLAMSCLGAFVHPLRLNFVEFFKNSGYEGRGAMYNPLGKNNN